VIGTVPTIYLKAIKSEKNIPINGLISSINDCFLRKLEVSRSEFCMEDIESKSVKTQYYEDTIIMNTIFIKAGTSSSDMSYTIKISEIINDHIHTYIMCVSDFQITTYEVSSNCKIIILDKEFKQHIKDFFIDIDDNKEKVKYISSDDSVPFTNEDSQDKMRNGQEPNNCLNLTKVNSDRVDCESNIGEKINSNNTILCTNDKPHSFKKFEMSIHIREDHSSLTHQFNSVENGCWKIECQVQSLKTCNFEHATLFTLGRFFNKPETFLKEFLS
jgi:hypothetical protein